MFRTRTAQSRSTNVALGAALFLSAIGSLLAGSIDAQAAKAAVKPAPVTGLAAVKLQEAGGSKVAIRLAKPAPIKLKVLVQTTAAPGANAATPKTDFAAKLQWVTIARGAKVGYFIPKVVNDAIDEPNERLRLRLVKSTKGAKLPALKHRSAIATIIDNDAPAVPAPTPAVVPVASVTPGATQVFEGDPQAPNARFTVTLSAPTTVPVSVPYSIGGGTAIAGTDYAATAPGTLQFAPGTTELTVDVPVLDDTIDEDEETAFFTLGAPTGATLGTNARQLTILDDEAAPKMTMTDVSLDEGTGPSTTFAFEIKLSHPSAKVVTVKTYTIETSANAGPNCALIGVDYIGVAPKVITFEPGETVKTIDVKVCGDNDAEGDEFFALPLTEITNATTTNPNGIGEIRNDD